MPRHPNEVGNSEVFTIRQDLFALSLSLFFFFFFFMEQGALRVDFQGISTQFGYNPGLADFLSFSVVV